jgi:hypothetical protein
MQSIAMAIASSLSCLLNVEASSAVPQQYHSEGVIRWRLSAGQQAAGAEVQYETAGADGLRSLFVIIDRGVFLYE